MKNSIYCAMQQNFCITLVQSYMCVHGGSADQLQQRQIFTKSLDVAPE